MIPCGSSPVTRFVLASAMRKTKRLRRRLIPVHVTVVLFKYNIIIYYNLLICFSQIYVKKNILKIPPHVLLPEDKVKKMTISHQVNYHLKAQCDFVIYTTA